jgi:hypothetical protein
MYLQKKYTFAIMDLMKVGVSMVAYHMDFEIVGFEWDRINTNHNIQKHGVQPEEAEDIFFNEPYFRVARTEDEGEKHQAAYKSHRR